MKLTATPDRKPFELAPEGAHNAVCYRVVDLGTHPVTGQYALNEKGQQKYNRRLSLYFEIEETMTDGRRFIIFETYTASFGEKANLRRFLKGWLGKDPGETFDTDELVGKPALLNLSHTEAGNGKTYVNIVSVMPLPKGFVPLKPENETFAFNIEEPWNAELYGKLSDWVKKTIEESKEYGRLFNKSGVVDEEPQGAPSPDTEEPPF